LSFDLSLEDPELLELDLELPLELLDDELLELELHNWINWLLISAIWANIDPQV
jgi:hypothetical protein